MIRDDNRYTYRTRTPRERLGLAVILLIGFVFLVLTGVTNRLTHRGVDPQQLQREAHMLSIAILNGYVASGAYKKGYEVRDGDRGLTADRALACMTNRAFYYLAAGGRYDEGTLKANQCLRLPGGLTVEVIDMAAPLYSSMFPLVMVHVPDGAAYKVVIGATDILVAAR